MTDTFQRAEGHHPTAHLTETGWMSACKCHPALDGCIRAERRATRADAVDAAHAALTTAGLIGRWGE